MTIESASMPAFGRLATKAAPAQTAFVQTTAMSSLLFVVASVAAVTTFAVAVLVAVRTIPAGYNVSDFIAILDGGYRIAQGQIPHVDFAVPHGAWPLVQGWVALKLSSWFAPFATYQVTQWLTVLPSTVLAAARQRTRLRQLALVGLVAGITLVPVLLDAGPVDAFAFYGGYNRLSTALLLLVVVWTVTPIRARGAGPWDLMLLLCLLLAVKITAFAAGLGIVGVAALLSVPKRHALLGAMTGVILLAGLLQITLGLPLAYLHDIIGMVAVNHGRGGYFVVSTIVKGIVPLVAASMCAACLLRHRSASVSRATLAAFRRPFVAARAQRSTLLVVAVAGATIVSESQATGNLGLLAMVGLVFAPVAVPASRRQVYALATTALVALLVGPWIQMAIHRSVGVVAQSMKQPIGDPALGALVPGLGLLPQTRAYASEIEHSWIDDIGAFGTAKDAEVVIDQSPALQPAAFAAYAHTIGEAVAVVRASGLVKTNTSVLTLGSVDMFARLLGARSAPHSALWQDDARTFKRPTPSQGRVYLRETDAVFSTVCGLTDRSTLLEQAFKPALDADFTPISLTACWTLWTRRTSL
jgi:hypothetical protein